MHTFSTVNKLGKKIPGEYSSHGDPKGLAIVMHGVGGNKKQEIIIGIRNAFYKAGYSTIVFTTTNTLSSESEGDYFDATTTNYLQDLGTIIQRAQENVYEANKGVILSGHCIGGLAVGIYASQNNQKMKGICLVSSILSKEIFGLAAGQEVIKAWEEEGCSQYLIRIPEDKTIKLPVLGKGFLDDLGNYDLISSSPLIQCPTLIIIGENDELIPIKYQEMLFDSLTGEKLLCIIPKGRHIYESQEESQQLYKSIENRAVSIK